MEQLEKLIEMRDEVRGIAEQTGPTPHLANLDATYTQMIAEASGEVSDAPVHEPRGIAEPDPKDTRIAELESRLAVIEKRNERSARDRLQAESAAEIQKPGRDIRPIKGRPRGMQRFAEGHAPPPEGEEDFVGRPPTLAEQQSMMPGQGGPRPLPQAEITGDGESVGLAQESKALLERKVGRKLA